MTVKTDPKYTSRPALWSLKAEHVLQLIHAKRNSGKTPEQILETVETWLYNVMVAGGVTLEHDGANVPAKLASDSANRTEEVQKG